MKNFAIIGAGGYIAPRHIKAIKETGNRLVAVTDPSDSMGVLDNFFLDVRYFPEIERFDRHLEKLRYESDEKKVHYVSICTPNYLHDAHVRLALRSGCKAICEKPLVINPWNLDQLLQVQKETDGEINTIMQLRLHPEIVKIKQRLEKELLENKRDRKHVVDLTYITGRGAWYHQSWKGIEERSGGLLVNIGIHFFDMLLWLFGKAQNSKVIEYNNSAAKGELELERAFVNWHLSVDVGRLPFKPLPGEMTTYRHITIDGETLEFTKGFTDLHTKSYEKILNGEGFGVKDARDAIELVHLIKQSRI
ncbi:MAG: Gfo/Idh/MocA family oxidoreductase [Deltaproteobacteria bacterium]|nr:Gfo/Idh/MocA family oxidoreductase [Deltaproteobacteria bacterium]